MLEDYLTKLSGGDFCDYGILKLSFNCRSDCLSINRALLTSSLYTKHKLVLIEKLTVAVTLNHSYLNGVNNLVGREALVAIRTFTAALNA